MSTARAYPSAGAAAVTKAQRPRHSDSRIISEQAWGAIARSLELSSRELQIVRLMFDDRTESAMAADLGIARRTVHTHFERMHHKLAVVDRLQLVLRVMDEFLALTLSPESELPPICAQWGAPRCPLRRHSGEASESLRR